MNNGTVVYSPLWAPSLFNLRLKNRRVIITSLGRELCCPRCKEYWPADTEFFHSQPSKRDGLFGWCKACYSVNDKRRRERDKQKSKVAK